MLFVVLVAPLVGAAILPREDLRHMRSYPLSLHFVTHPLAEIPSSIIPTILTVTLYVVHIKLPVVNRAVSPLEQTAPLLLSVRVLAFIDGPIWPSLLPEPILLVLKPVTLVCRPIHVSISALSCCDEIPFRELCRFSTNPHRYPRQHVRDGPSRMPCHFANSPRTLNRPARSAFRDRAVNLFHDLIPILPLAYIHTSI